MVDEDYFLESILYPWLESDCMADSPEEREADDCDWDGSPLWWDDEPEEDD